MAYVAVGGPLREETRVVLTGLDERESNQQAFAEGALALLAEMLAQG